MLQKVKFGLFMMLLMFSLLAAEDFEQKISRNFDLTPGGSIELANINGEITISTAAAAVVRVLAVKRSDDKGEIENVEVVFQTGQDSLKVYTKYNKKNTHAKVDFTVVIPERIARAVFKSVNGALYGSGKFRDLTLKTVNGRIKFSGDFASAALNSVNGGVDISQEAQLSGDLSVGTVNGGVSIEINRKSAFSLEGRSVNGGIRCDFPVTIERHFVGSSLNGDVNGGGHKISLETVNGRIRISKI